MSSWFCGCGRCTAGAVTGPLLLIALGTLFAIQEAGSYRFRDTWPVLLISGFTTPGTFPRLP